MVCYTSSNYVKMRLHWLSFFIFLVCGEEGFQPPRTRASYASSANHVRTGPPALSQHRYSSLNTEAYYCLAVLYYQTTSTLLIFLLTRKHFFFSSQRPETPQHPGVHAQCPRSCPRHDLRLWLVQEAGSGPPQFQSKVWCAGHWGLDRPWGPQWGLQR